jgi:ElaB/YqjD/DUF883 family membrane-anchored ribosome-binding protein
MDNTPSSTSTTPAAASGTTPFPTETSKPSTAPATPANDSAAAKPGDAQGAAPAVDNLIKRVTQSAHDAVDSLAAKLTSVSDGLQGSVDKVGDTRDEWIESARDAIRQHPFAAVAGALVIGAALLSLRSSRD